jgi:hypothetical protein
MAKKLTHIHRVKGLGGLKFIAVVFFVYAAVVQVNDPDALVWLMLYVSAGTLTLVSMIVHYPPLVTGGLAVICICWAAMIFPAALGEGMALSKEEPRELFGLAIVSIWMVWLSVHHRHRQRDEEIADDPKRPSELP